MHTQLFDMYLIAIGDRRINGSRPDPCILPRDRTGGENRRRPERDAVHTVHRVDSEINGALITLIEALRRIDTTPIGPVSFRDTDRSYDK